MKSDAAPRSLLYLVSFLLIAITIQVFATQPPAVSPLSLSGNITGVAIEKIKANAEWRSWIDRYLSPSPLLAINKTEEKMLQVRGEDIDRILKGETVIKFEKPFVLKGKEFKEIDILDDDSSRRFNALDSLDSMAMGNNSLVASKEETRFNDMSAELEKLIIDRKPDELLILFIGRTHAFDLYFSFFLQDPNKFKHSPFQQRREEIWYLGLPIEMKTPFYTADYYNLRKTIDGVATPETSIADSSVYLATSYLARLAYYHRLREGVLNRQILESEKIRSLGTIVLMDIHFLNSPAAYEAMPSAEALKAMGFKKIKVGVEGWKAGKSYNLSQFDWQYRSPHLPFLWDYEQEFLRKKSKSMEQKYLNGEIVFDAGVAALHKKLKAYEIGGIPVSLVGIEEFEKMGPYDIVARNSLDPANR